MEEQMDGIRAACRNDCFDCLTLRELRKAETGLLKEFLYQKGQAEAAWKDKAE